MSSRLRRISLADPILPPKHCLICTPAPWNDYAVRAGAQCRPIYWNVCLAQEPFFLDNSAIFEVLFLGRPRSIPAICGRGGVIDPECRFGAMGWANSTSLVSHIADEDMLKRRRGSNRPIVGRSERIFAAKRYLTLRWRAEGVRLGHRCLTWNYVATTVDVRRPTMSSMVSPCSLEKNQLALRGLFEAHPRGSAAIAAWIAHRPEHPE
jgi:hypothetical protein